MTDDPLAYLHAAHAAAQAEAEAARDFDYAQCGVWEARGPYPAECGEADGVLRPRGNLRAEIGKDDIFLDAELPWDLIPHIARHDPAAALRRIKADRKQLELHAPIPGSTPGGDGIVCGTCANSSREEVEGDPYPCATVRLIAEGWGWTGET